MALSLRSRPALLFALSSALVYAAELAIVRSSAFAAHPGRLGPAVAFDLAVFVPGLYWLLVLRVGSGSWLAFFGVLTLAWAGAPFILPASERHDLSALLVAGPVAEAICLGYAAVRVRRIARAYRAWRGDPADVLVRLRQALVAGMGDNALWRACADELSMWRYALKPPAPIASPDAFAYHRRSAWAALVLALAMVGAVETAGVHLLVALWSAKAAWLLSFSSAYAVLWLVGDVRACARRPLLLQEEAVLVRVGLRWTVRVPYQAIASLEPLRAGKASPPARRAPGYLRATAFGAPTLLLELSRELTAEGPYGIRKPVQRIGLAPDDLPAFLAALGPRVGQPRS